MAPRWAGWLLVLLPLLVSGCATRGVLDIQSDNQNKEAVVWPPAPEIGRYRYVGELTGEKNFKITGAKARSAVRKVIEWIAGFAFGKREQIVLQRPQSGAVDSEGRIYVTDVSRQAVYVFDPVDGRLHTWEMAAPDTRFKSPVAIALGDHGEIFVTDSDLAVVVRLNNDGEPAGFIGKGVLTRPTGIARNPADGLLYIADTNSHDIKVFNVDGTLIKTLGKRGEDPGTFNAPTHLAFAQGNLYVSDTLNSRVQILTKDGEVKTLFGRRGLFVGDMPRPKGIAVDQNGYVYVVESYYDHLLVFDGQGEFLLPIGGTGSGIGQFYLPAGIWTHNNQIYVADMFNGRVVIFEFIGGSA